MKVRLLLGLAILIVVAGVVTLVTVLTRPSDAESVVEQASSTMAGTDASALVERALAEPEPTTAADAGPTWRSDGQTDGAWVSLTWDEPTAVSRVRVDGLADADGAYTDALLMFGDGSSVLVTPDAEGDVLVDIPRRVIRSATLRFGAFPDGATSVALDALLIDDSGQHIGEPERSTVTATLGTSDPAAVQDGRLASGNVGAVWRSEAADAWVQHAWDAPVAVASVQLAGPLDTAEPGGGALVFSDGSRVLVSGVGSGSAPVTTVAFAPRIVTSVRFEPELPDAQVSEFRVYGPGVTPPAWPTEGGIAVEPPAAQECLTDAPAIGQPQDSALALVCPEVGATVGPEATIVVDGPPGQKASVTAWTPIGETGSIVTIAESVIAEDGRARISFDTERLPHGPIAVRVAVPGSTVPLYVQLFNRVGKDPVLDEHAPAGMTLQFEDTFESPLSVTYSGAGSRFAATKPVGTGGQEFGGAVFDDPANGRDLMATMDDTLRIRVQPFEGEDPRGWDRTFASGILSSMRVGGSGFSAQYGYFEARILAPGGRGTWPAFWMLDTNSTVRGFDPHSEVDAVELYGHNTLGACHSLHNWPIEEIEGTGAECFPRNGHGDWALEWHTYGVQIRPNGADYFIDGVKITTREGLLRDSLPYYFMLDLSVDGGWPVMLDPTGGTADMYVDWVRVYS